MENFLNMAIGFPTGLTLFGQKEYFELFGFVIGGERYVSNQHWFLHIEIFNDCEPNEDVTAFLNGLFEKNDNWHWSVIAEGGVSSAPTDYIQGIFAKETNPVEVTALTYHPNSNLSYRICMIAGQEVKPLFVDEQYLKMTEHCGLTLHATGGSCEAVILRGPDAGGTICDYGIVMPADISNCNAMALEVFQVLNKYPDVTIDPNHFNILGIKPAEGVVENV